MKCLDSIYLKTNRSTHQKFNVNSPIISKNQLIPSSFRTERQSKEKLEKQLFIGPQSCRMKKLSMDDLPKYINKNTQQNQAQNLVTLQNDEEMANYIQTSRKQRSTQVQCKTQLVKPTKLQTKRLSNPNDNILDLLLLNTQELKDIFEKPISKAKPRIRQKGFPTDFL